MSDGAAHRQGLFHLPGKRAVSLSDLRPHDGVVATTANSQWNQPARVGPVCVTRRHRPDRYPEEERRKPGRQARPVPSGAKGLCHVDGCGADLAGLKEYHLRYKVGEGQRNRET